ncbi:MAG TPA: DEAD/DEAH box helicase, partial [Phycisphaerales bacterium]|nr:DEAD/DEAH box helicase [Phycisphaerales bacterium]
MTDTIEQTLRQTFGFDTLRPKQTPVIKRILGIDTPAGDALVVWPTGSGKSLCYQLPAMVLRAERGRGVSLVFSPLIALMEDQVSALRAKGVRAQYVNSTLSKKE